MEDTPLYAQTEQHCRRLALRDFLTEMVFPKDFDMCDLKEIEARVRDEPAKAAAFCNWLGLGEWFIDEIVWCNFDVEEFLNDLEMQIEEADREAAEYEREVQQDYKEAVGMGNM